MDPFSLDHIINFLITSYVKEQLPTHVSDGGMGNRTPDIQLAKLTLYQLSYTPLLGYATVVIKNLGKREILQQSVPSTFCRVTNPATFLVERR